MYELRYDDGEYETVDLSRELFKIVGGKTARSTSTGKEDNDEMRGGVANGESGEKKRRRILEESEDDDDDDEELLDDDVSEEEEDSGSEYKAIAGDESMDDSLENVTEKEDDWLESDDDDNETKKKKKVTKFIVKKVKIHPTLASDTIGDERRKFVSPTPVRGEQTAGKAMREGKAGGVVTKDLDFSNYLSQAHSDESPKRSTATTSTTVPPSSKPITQSQLSPMHVPPLNHTNDRGGGKSTTLSPIPPVPNAVNVAGSHMHNHLKFFTTHRKDANMYPMDHPNYSPRTLYVDYNELDKAHGKDSNGKYKVTSPAQRQWWEIKSQYADTVLLFKTGKFYEMFHDDADVGVAVLNFVYMKGTPAHAGFPESAYGTMVSQLVEAGYKVARVEQTETPASLQERKKSMTRGQKKPEVVCREVCSVVSKGTRTFCYLDDVTLLEKGEASTGPLVVIKEMLVDDDAEALSTTGEGMDVDDGDDLGTRAVCEYGVTIVDAVTGVVTLGQFADDVLRSRMQTLLTRFGPMEVIYEGGPSGASKTLINVLKSACPPNTVIECIHPKEHFPKSTAIDANVRRMLDRTNIEVKPWDVNEALAEVHRRGYYPRSSRNNVTAVPMDVTEGIARWPEILRACIEGGATLALSSFGAALFYLQRSLVDAEILNLGIIKAYAPPNTSETSNCSTVKSSSISAKDTSSSNPSTVLQDMFDKEAQGVAGMVIVDEGQNQPPAVDVRNSVRGDVSLYSAEADVDHMALDGTTLSNLEILHNITSGQHHGSLLSKIDCTQSPHGSRLLRAWLLRPLFRKEEIDRRADVVEELAGGSAAMAMLDARTQLKKTGDIERLLSRVHSMGGNQGHGNNAQEGGVVAAYHPDERAVLYENDKHTKRKVGDFSKLLHGLRAAADIPELFQNVKIHSPMLRKIVRTTEDGGCFPSGLKVELDWFFDNFDLKKAEKGEFEPCRGMDDAYDEACDTIEDIKRELEAYKQECCSSFLRGARSSWTYINMREDSKDKYLIELPASFNVPNDFYVKAKRGSGAKQVNKYRTPVVEQLVHDLERAIDVKNAGKAAGMKIVFAKFADKRSVWMACTQASAMLDALGSLALIAVQPGYSRPVIVDCPPSAKPGIEIIQGRHPCVDTTHSGSDFIPNDLVLGRRMESDNDGDSYPIVLLLSGPNMGGKSTLLRQTCLIAIMAQIGSFVPAERCALTPVDRIYTRLGASDRILCGQSTFFVELAETAAAARGATRRSLVIMDELGRGTSTFDGTAIASATVKHLVERNKCLTLFATHYHSLLEDWKEEESIKLGHMECIVEDDNEDDSARKSNITFLYTLGDGPCPKSFGVNVARLAGLPDDVIQKAKAVSSLFEAELSGQTDRHAINPSTAEALVSEIKRLVLENDFDRLRNLWESLQ